MERISRGGRPTVGFGDRWVAGYPLDVREPKNRIPTSACGKSLAPVQSQASYGEIGCGSSGEGGVLVPPWLAGTGAGAGVAGLAFLLGAPTWGTVVGGVGTALSVWAALR